MFEADKMTTVARRLDRQYISRRLSVQTTKYNVINGGKRQK